LNPCFFLKEYDLVIIYLFILLFGAALGSFFNVCISRIPSKGSIVFPASHCPKCKHKIRKYDNIPVLSYLILKGKCRDCGLKIPAHYFLVEIITPLLFLLVFIISGNRFNLFFLKYIVFISFGIIIFFIDLHHKLIPNKLSLPLLLSGIVFTFIKGSDISVSSAMIGCGGGFLLFLLLAYLFQWITNKESLGGGDIKLIAGIGIYTGISGTVFTIIFASVIALFTLLLIRHDLKKEFPFGPFLIAAAILHIVAGNWLFNLYLNLFI